MLVFNFKKFVLWDVKLLTMGHGTKFKSTVPSHETNPSLISQALICFIFYGTKTVFSTSFNNCVEFENALRFTETLGAEVIFPSRDQVTALIGHQRSCLASWKAGRSADET